MTLVDRPITICVMALLLCGQCRGALSPHGRGYDGMARASFAGGIGAVGGDRDFTGMVRDRSTPDVPILRETWNLKSAIILALWAALHHNDRRSDVAAYSGWQSIFLPYDPDRFSCDLGGVVSMKKLVTATRHG